MAKKPAKIATRIERLPLAELELLELNARYLRHETYQQLVANIKRDGGLTSVPFAWLNPETGRYRVLSGNHRVSAAIDAGIETAEVMVTDDALPEQQRIAIQLAHNAIAGEDDASVLRELYDKLDVDLRIYSGLDDKDLALMGDASVAALSPAALDWQSVAFLFLPDELERARAAFELARAQIATDEIWLGSRGDCDRTLDAIADAGAAHGIRNVSTALTIVLDVFEAHRDDLADGFLDEQGQARHSGEVPLAAVLGSDRVPAAIAARLRRRLEAIAGRKEITLVQALAVLLADMPEDGEAERAGAQRAPEDGEAARSPEGAGRASPRRRQRVQPPKRPRRRRQA